MNPLGFLVLAAAVFMILAAIADWFRIPLWVRIFGRNGARLFYVLVGLGLLWLGIMMLMGAER